MTFPDFDQYLRAVHGRHPFPWQQALVDRILSVSRGPAGDPRAAWPEVIDVPTGLGKTAVIDVAIYLAAALGKESPFRRIFFVVDRRIVVDEAFDHAKRIQEALGKPDDPAIEAVARALLQGGDRESVLDVTKMRGGVTWDARWVERPDRYAIVTGTVDQVGSRLLFRGYGVSREARPIDAALVGTDSLIIIDEAHLAGPLLETMDELRALDTAFQDSGPTVVRMSATHSSGGLRAHTIDEADNADPVAGPRLRAPKSVHLIEVKATKTAAAVAVPDALARLGLSLAGPDRVVGIVVNTVARARAVFERVKDKHDAVLLTGRSRPIDRDHLHRKFYGRLKAGRPKAGGPFILVATQTIEVGADIDLDALVTESAALSALVQRLGRLNRRGELAAAPALVVHDTSVADDDSVYGPARAATWTWLTQRAAPTAYTPRLDPASLSSGLDASPLALRALTAKQPPELAAPTAYEPVLPRSTLDAWVRTSPEPALDPPIEPFLHGIAEGRPSVQVIWRVGLPTSDDGWTDQRAIADALGRVPTTADEALEVPLVAVRRWLESAADTPTLSDQDTEADIAFDIEARPARATRYRAQDGRVWVVRVGGRDDAEAITADRIRPNSLIVVPIEYGGCDEFGWHPTSTTPVVDVADLAHRRGRPTVRVGEHLRSVIAAYEGELADDTPLRDLLSWAKVFADPANDEDDGTTISKISKLAEALSGGPLATNLGILLKATDKRRVIRWGVNEPWQIEIAVSGAAFADDRSSHGSSIADRRLRLDQHQQAVAQRAVEFARNLGLDSLADDLELAARLHDEGKRDPRFQAMLWGGDRRRAEVALHLLAKSGMDPSDRAAHRRAQRAAGYPSRMRHEALSAQIAVDQVRSLGATDPELVVHLVAAHHGHSRPLLPPVGDPDPHLIAVGDRKYDTAKTVDWDGPARFTRLNEKYGRWGLARLETIVRLADIWCSARNEDGVHVD